MVNAIGATSLTTDEVSKEKATQNLGRDDFLKIFLAQMRNQDPLNPMEGTEFTSQLAQFSSLEQLFNVNENLESIKGVQNNTARYEALNLIGKDIVAQGDQITLSEGLNAKGAFSLQGQGDCIVIISDGAGNPVRTLRMGTLSAGEHLFNWDGMDEAGSRQPSGVYQFKVLAQSATGQILPAQTMISGRVDRVSLEGDSPVLYVGKVPVTFTSISDVQMSSESQGDEETTDIEDPGADNSS